jgi:histidinol-phosphate aminotransferase
VQEQYGLDEVFKLASNENPLPTAASVTAAISHAAEGLNRYPPMGDGALRSALAAHLGRGLTADHFVTGNGGCDVLFMVANSLLSPGDEAIICPPTFPVYEWSVRRIGATLVTAPLNDDFSLNVERILAAVTPRTRLLYLCSPNNPTGSIVTQAELDALMSHLPPEVVVVSDEVYHHFNTAADYANSYPYIHDGRNLIILHSFSKVFGLAGLRLGYAITTPILADYFARARLPFHLSSLVFAAGQAALAERDYLEQSMELTITERQRVYTALQAVPGLTVYPSQANFVLIKPEQDAPQLAQQLEQKGVMVRDMTGFYLPGYLRVSMGLPRENDQLLACLQDRV